MFEEPLSTHRRLRYSVRGPEWAFVIPQGDMAALEQTMRRCSSFWNGAGSLIVPIRRDGRLPASLEDLLEVRAVDLAWVHESIDESLQEKLRRTFGQLARLHERFDEHETHPLRLLGVKENPAPRLVVPACDTASARLLGLALWGEIAEADVPYYRDRCELTHARAGAATWKALIDGQIAGPVTSPLLTTQTGMRRVWSDSSAEYPYIWVFAAQPSFASLVAFWNLRARLIANAAGAPVLGAPYQALSNPGALSSLREWLDRGRSHRSTPDCLVCCTDRQAPIVERALAAVPMLKETATEYSHQFGKDIQPNEPPTFAFARAQLWARFRRGLVNTQLVSITDGRTSLVLGAPHGFEVRDMSRVRLTIHDLPLVMPVTERIAEAIIGNAVPGDGGVRITTSAMAEWNLDVRLPSASRALSDWASDRGFEVTATREAMDAEAILKRLGSLEALDVLASKQRLALLECLAPPSARKLAQHLVAELERAGESVEEETIAEQLQSMSLFLELRGRTAGDLASLIGGGMVKKQALALLPGLIGAGLVRRARDVVCPECRYRTLLDLTELAEVVRCRACHEQFTLPVVDASAEKEPDTTYRLDGLMARAMSQDLVPVLLALRAFSASRTSGDPFAAWPGLEFKPHDRSRATEVDLVVSFGRIVYCCEVKRTGHTIGETQLSDLLGLCERLQARPALAAVNGAFPDSASVAVRERGGRVLEEETLLAELPNVHAPLQQFGKFAGLATQSGVWR